MSAATKAAGRLAMQDWCAFPLYFDQKTWDAIQAAPATLAAMDVCLKRLVALGLRSPSERTQAVLAALCILRDDPKVTEGTMPESTKLRSIFLNVKARVDTYMFRAKQDKVPLPNDDFVVCLPLNPQDCASGFLAFALPEGPVTNPPFSMIDISTVAREISLRNTNKKIQQNTNSMAPETFWAGFQAFFGMMLQQANHMGRQQDSCHVSMVQRPPAAGKALGDLLQRAEVQPSQKPLLALPAPPEFSPPAPCPAVSRQEQSAAATQTPEQVPPVPGVAQPPVLPEPMEQKVVPMQIEALASLCLPVLRGSWDPV